MALTLNKLSPNADTVYGNHRVKYRTADFDDSYPAGGEPLTADDLGLRHLHRVEVLPKNGYTFEYDKANEKLIANAQSVADTEIEITDLDAAAAAGVAVYVHVDEVLEQGSALAHLEFVSPTNTDATALLHEGGPTLYVQDDDAAATGGVALYFDEDAALGSRLLANTGRDCYVNVGGGRFVKVTHNATPGTPGVQVYLDEDAANAYEKLLFVSPTDEDGLDVTSGEVANAFNLSTLTGVEIKAIGF